LAAAIRVQEAPVGASGNGGLAFPSQDAKDQQSLRVFTDLQTKYSGSAEGQIAQYYLGAIKADQGKLAEAEKLFQVVAQKGDDHYASLAKLSLAQIYFADGRNDQGEKMLRDLMAHPTVFVSKEQAAITLARYLAPAKPAEARKLLDPLRNTTGAVGQVVLSMIGELPPQ
jgi:predicted negative regulator of RcsB-dependent stress response